MNIYMYVPNDVLSLSHIMQLIKTIKIAYTIKQYEN